MRLAGRKAHDIIELGEADGWRSPRFARLRPNRQGDPSDSRARSLTPFQAVRPAPAMCEELVEMIAGGTTASAWASIRFGPTPYTIASMPTLSVRNAAFQRACRVLDRYGTAARRALDVERHCSHVRYCWPLRRLGPGVTGFFLQVMHLFSSLACLVRSAAMSAAVLSPRDVRPMAPFCTRRLRSFSLRARQTSQVSLRIRLRVTGSIRYLPVLRSIAKPGLRSEPVLMQLVHSLLSRAHSRRAASYCAGVCASVRLGGFTTRTLAPTDAGGAA
jgi:hypothetical protein